MAPAITRSVPNWLAIAAFIMLGSLTGTRFAGMDLRAAAAARPLPWDHSLVGAVVFDAVRASAASVLSLNIGDAVLAYAPGAIEAMMILALALHFDPAFVAAHHLWRFMMVLVALPLLCRCTIKGAPADAESTALFRRERRRRAAGRAAPRRRPAPRRAGRSARRRGYGVGVMRSRSVPRGTVG